MIKAKRKERSSRSGLAKANPIEARAWAQLRNRCMNERTPDYKNYGARGIQVCDRWCSKEGFALFFQDMGPRPSDRHSIERVDNNDNYSPDNCVWAIKSVQMRNRRKFSNNTSGYKGVSWNADSKRWSARVWRGRNIFLGYFSNARDAAKAYQSYVNKETKV